MLHELTSRKKAEMKVRTRLDYYLKMIKMLRKYGFETSRCFSKTIRVSMQSSSVLRGSNVFLTVLTSSLTGSVYGLISLRPNKADKRSGVDLR